VTCQERIITSLESPTSESLREYHGNASMLDAPNKGSKLPLIRFLQASSKVD
jgi:hypothetical protein